MISKFLGIDTSNYTTSAAVLDKNGINNSKLLLPVDKGTVGLRQSDAVFHHTKQLPQVLSALDMKNITAIGVSTRPRSTEDSYMPCFLVGQGISEILSEALCVPLYCFSHQQGHVAAALYSADKLSYLEQPFFAFHFSGGTSDCLFIKPGKGRIPDIKTIGHSLDLKVGQAIDRLGVKLGFSFPAGKFVDECALNSKLKYKISPYIKGLDFSISGLENKCDKMIADNVPKEDICRFCLSYISEVLLRVSSAMKDSYGNFPVIMSGGVTSSRFIRKYTSDKLDAAYADPVFSADNAAGVAVLAAISEGEL